MKSKYPVNKKSSAAGVNNNVIKLEGLRLSSEGVAVGYHEGKATFVPGLLPGEIGQVQIVEVKKNWQRGKLLEILKASPDRIKPPCSVFNVCGGCQLQHLKYEQTLVWKKQWVADALARIGKISLDSVTIHPTIGMDYYPWRYRNKARLHWEEQGSLGYYQEKSKATVPFEDCLLISEEMNGWVREVEEFLGEQDKESYPSLTSITFRENSRGEGMLIMDALPEASLADTPLLPGAQRLGECLGLIRWVWGINSSGVPVRLAGQGDFDEDVLGAEFKISPLAFLQVNPSQTHRLYYTVLDWAKLSTEKVVWDLYCGIGTITLALAGKAKKVWGIEENPYAVADAQENARRNAIDNVEFIAGKVEDTFRQISDSPDIVVLDPPRAGAHKRVLERLLELGPDQIIYVSCDPGTLARDLGILQSGGYRVAELQPVDMFPWTVHVETVVLMSRVEK
ncbi:23S rRNA (uracil-5-)-methyltransferase RumA [Desulfosporosinus orientis DSM 765]|uniref:23S rRNA (Uracil-5-)-methyltransferase RumA n=1 Tax=Desulfosporosinus orientis (strain ATCC 19365 / DSM 765 / NCIMB 8382 / VKM B-1628 / Singapore I) TaxID=768706 RepID=G7WBT3_DESOD|nr:23S rRNA (uracil(1939)-C(5))-methyltransferase RlmD [Desulfosporosinus orientis]AET69330.1 23S rRNA (uracil-5-)-methyltransferase RumA [Desulfosporosinus orientis DSM 765]